jgi:hypothetical protein
MTYSIIAKHHIVGLISLIGNKPGTWVVEKATTWRWLISSYPLWLPPSMFIRSS